jgi:hypothetical protein
MRHTFCVLCSGDWGTCALDYGSQGMEVEELRAVEASVSERQRCAKAAELFGDAVSTVKVSAQRLR